MGADQCLVGAIQKLAHRIHLRLGHPRLVHARSVAQVPLWGYLPIQIEAMLAQGFIGEAAADGTLGHHDDGLLHALVVELVQRDEHQRAGLARCRRRLDQQILLTALGIGALLHGAHPQRVGLAGCTGVRRSD